MFVYFKKIIFRNQRLINSLISLSFLKTGILNSIFGYSTYAFFLFLGFKFQTSLFLATILGICFNYVTFGQIVFKSKHSSLTFIKFIFTYLFVYFINVTMLKYFQRVIDINPYIAQILCLIPIIFLNWFLLKFWVYKKDL